MNLSDYAMVILVDNEERKFWLDENNHFIMRSHEAKALCHLYNYIEEEDRLDYWTFTKSPIAYDFGNVCCSNFKELGEALWETLPEYYIRTLSNMEIDDEDLKNEYFVAKECIDLFINTHNYTQRHTYLHENEKIERILEPFKKLQDTI